MIQSSLVYAGVQNIGLLETLCELQILWCIDLTEAR